MSALIAMSVYSTEENQKDEYLEQTLDSLWKTVDFDHHRLILSVNGATEQTHDIIDNFGRIIHKVIWNEENIGTAEAINKVIHLREAGQHVVKIDDDVTIYRDGWIDLMQECIERDNQIGIIGLKRRDLIQTTWHPDTQYKSELVMLPHAAGQRWLYVERTPDIMGTCTMYNSALLDKIGFLRQIKKYGYDDNIACHRSHIAGFYNCFLIGVDIEHTDRGDTPYQDWKHKHSGECTAIYIQLIRDMVNGTESIYYNPFSNEGNL